MVRPPALVQARSTTQASQALRSVATASLWRGPAVSTALSALPRQGRGLISGAAARRRLLLDGGVLGSLLDHALLLPLVNKEVGHDASRDEDGREGPGRLFQRVGRLARAENLPRGPAGGNARKPLSLPALHKDHQNHNGREQCNDDDHEREHNYRRNFLGGMGRGRPQAGLRRDYTIA